MKKKLKVFIISIIAGILYHLGGTGGTWWKNTKVRDLGVSFCCLGIMLLLGYSFSWPLVLSTLLLFSALTTYWKKINRFFGDTDENCHYYNWFIHGLFCGLAYLPMYFTEVSIWLIFTRSVLLAIFIGAWSEVIDKVSWEEFGRGFLIAISLLMFK